MSQSSSLASPTATSPATRARALVAEQLDPGVGAARRGSPGRNSLGDGRVDEQRLGGVADAGALHLGVDGDPPRHLQIGVGVHVDVAVARRRVHHRHRRDLLDAAFRPSPPRGIIRSTSPPGSPARPARRGRRRRAAAPRPPAGRPRRAPRGRSPASAPFERSRVAGAAQDDRVAALDRQRRAVDRDVRPRLVDDGDDAERHADLAQVEAAGQRLRARAPRRPGRPARRPRARPSAIAAIRSVVSASRSRSAVAQPGGALVGEVGGVRLEDLPAALAEQPGGRLERGVLGLRGGAAKANAAAFAASQTSVTD